MDRTLLRGFLSVFSAKLGTVAITIVLTPVLVRLLGTAGYGAYSFVLSALGILLIVVNAGIYDGTRKFIAEDRSHPNWSANVFGFYLRLAAVFAIVAAGLLALVTQSGLVTRLFGAEFERYFWLLVVLLCVRQLFQTVRGGLMGLGLESRSELFVIGRKMTFAVAAVGLAVIGWGVAGVLVGQILSYAVFSLPALYVLARHLDLGAVAGRLPSGFPRRPLALFNIESVVLVLLMTSLYHVDILLLQPLRGSQATGVYRAALLVAEFLWFVPFTVQTVLLHSSSALWSRGETDRLSKLSSRITRYTLSLSVLLALGIAGLIDPFVHLYFGPGFGPTAPAVLLLLPGALGFAVARPIFAIGQGSGQLRLLIAATGGAAVLNLLLNLLLIPRYGLFGAAVATSIGYGSMLVVHVIAARKIGFDPFAAVRPLRLGAVTVCSAPVIFGAAWLIPAPVSLLVVPPVGALTFALCALQFEFVTDDELADLCQRLPPGVAGPIRRLLRMEQ
jgi:O-antigen/teichoic acid export membrane protein